MPLILTVPQNHAVVVERFGRFSSLKNEGLRFLIPFLDNLKLVSEWDNIANKQGLFIELSEQRIDSSPRQAQTLDNVTIETNVSVYFRIMDPVKAVYEVDCLPRSLSDVALNALRSNVGKMKLDELLSNREKLNQNVVSQLINTSDKWGVSVSRVEIQEINYTSETADAMLQEMAAERGRRAKIAEAEGEAKAITLKAEAQAQAIKMIAEAEQEYIGKLSEKLPPDQASNLLLAQKYISGFDTISKNPAHKVFIPNNFNGILDTANGSK